MLNTSKFDDDYDDDDNDDDDDDDDLMNYTYSHGQLRKMVNLKYTAAYFT